MKRIYAVVSIIACLACFFAFPGFVHANEGKFSIGTNGVDCEGVSIWQDRVYKITGICNGLVYPYHDQQTLYMLWVQPDTGGNPVRVSEIDNGIISGNTVNKFTGIFITAESDGGTQTPGTTRIASGNLSLFNFPLPYQNQGTNQTGFGSQSPSGTPTPTISPDPPPASTGNLNLTSKSSFALIPIIIILFVIFGITFLFKRQ